MAKEMLIVSEEHLDDVIKVIRAGLKMIDKKVDDDVKKQLTKWCDDEEEYLNI